MTTDHETYADWDGAYVVGALSPMERADFERHLGECAECRAAVADLAPLPGLLARVDPAEAETLLTEDTPAVRAETLVPPAGLERRLLAAAGDQPGRSEPWWRRTRVRVGVGLAAAAAVAAAVVVPLATRDDHPGTPPGVVSVALDQTVDSPLTADVALTPVAWGTKVDMTCWYAKEPYAAVHSYALYVVDRGGAETLVSRWHARPGQEARTSGSTDLAVADISRVELRDGGSGRLLLAGRPG